jgi:APA family basic amino acid/polyamine antiporter
MAAGDRVEDAERNVPRATLIGVSIAGLIYLLACSAVTLMLPVAALETSNAPFATFFASLVDPRLGPIVAAFAAVAALGALNGFVLLQAEIPLGLARGGLLPAWTARFNRNEIPWRLHILSSGLATLLILSNYARGLADLFRFMVLVTTSVTIVFYFVSTLSGLVLAGKGRIRVTTGFLAAAIGALLYSVWAFYGAGIEASLWSLAMTAAGIPVYLIMRANLSRRPGAPISPAA